MNVLRAKTAGFCMGVSLALRRLDKSIKQYHATKRLVMFGPIIHNPQVLRYYQEQGVICTENPDELGPDDAVVVRAHGIPLPLEQTIRNRGVTLVDATCPKVKAAQLSIAKSTADGAQLLLFGEASHPEVRGLVSYANGACKVFSSLNELTEHYDGPVVLAAQTTQENTVFQAIAGTLRRQCRELQVLSTICDATSKRQCETAEIARKVELMIVIGGKSSGNTRRLADVARNEGIPALHVETRDELPLDELKKCRIVGLTAGASTPGATIDETQKVLEAL